MHDLRILYLQLEGYGNVHISSLEEQDGYINEESIYYHEEEKELIKQIINIEINNLLEREKFVKVNKGSRDYHCQEMIKRIFPIINSIVIGCYNRGEDFNIGKVQDYIQKELKIFLPEGHITIDFPYRLKQVLLQEKEDSGELYHLDATIEKHYDKLLEPYLIRRNIVNCPTYMKDGANYEFYLNKVKTNIKRGLINKILNYEELTPQQQLLFQETGVLMSYITTAIRHTFPKAKNGIYQDEYEVQVADVDIDSLKSYREDTNVNKQVAQYVMRDVVNQNAYLESALRARNKIIDSLRDILNLKSAPHHILMYLDIAWINKVPGVVNKDEYKTKVPYSQITLKKYYHDIFYDIKNKVEYSINEHLLVYTDHTLEEDDYDQVSYNLSHKKPYKLDKYIGEYTLGELSPTVTNITQWKKRIEKDLEEEKSYE